MTQKTNHEVDEVRSSRIGSRRHGLVIWTAMAASLLLAVPALAGRGHGGREDGACVQTADHMYAACRYEATDDQRVEQARCLNLSDADERRDCRNEAWVTKRETFDGCKESRAHRKQICEDLDEGRYDPVVDPANFVSAIDNPFAPFTVGSVWQYEKMTPEGLEEIHFEVLAETRVIAGITATTIRDQVWLDGVYIEDTLDWVAQDVNGDVWYLGEVVLNFEDGRVVNTDGTWEVGRDGAKPGLWITGNPTVGQFYRQEWRLGEAEDIVEVLSVDATGFVFPFANGSPVLQTRDYVGVEPGGDEWKFYVPGVGMVLEVDPETGERLELISYTP